MTTGDETAIHGDRDSMPLLEVDRLTVGFGDAPILRDITLSIRRGDTVAVIGESGCGKSVFMKTLVGLLRPTSGAVRFDGRDVHAAPDAERLAMKRRIGFVFQNAALFDSLSVFDNAAFPLVQTGEDPRAIRGAVDARLREVGIPADAFDRFPVELSGGMRKRVGLARALALTPELIVYDEPTTGLDPIMSDVINELMLGVRRRHPVTSVIVTHDMNTARKVADRVLMFHPRRRLPADACQVIYDGPPSGLDHDPDRRVRNFVRGVAADRLAELAAVNQPTDASEIDHG